MARPLNVNPVLVREVTERLRSLRAFVLLSIFVLVLTFTTYLTYAAAQNAGGFDLADRSRVGRLVFESVLLIMTILVLFFVPGVTAGAISGERERQTLSTLQVTLLRPGSIIVGKVMAALAYLGLLLVAALPVLAVSYVLGGITLADVVRGVAAVAFVALTLAVMVVALSAFTKRVQGATVLAYAFTVLLVVSGVIAYGAVWIIDERAEGEDAVSAPPALLATSPIVFVASAAAGTADRDDTPLAAIDGAVGEAWERNGRSWSAWQPDRAFADGGGPLRHPGSPAWPLGAAFLTVVAAGMAMVAARRLRAPAEVER